MSSKDTVILASRTLAVLLMVWALSEISSLPGNLYSFLHYASQDRLSSGFEYYRHLHLIALGFLFIRILGFSLVARWLFKGGPEIEELLLPASEETAVQR